MSSSIQIPARSSRFGEASKATPTSSASSYSESPRSPSGFSSSSPTGDGFDGRTKRRSLLSTSFSKQEHTVINIGDSESPRLITCVRSGQGFDWNPELFLSSHVESDFQSAERMRDVVHEIRLTEDEMKQMLPQ